MKQTLKLLVERRPSYHSKKESFSLLYRVPNLVIITVVYLFVLAVNQIAADLSSMVLLLVSTIIYNFLLN